MTPKKSKKKKKDRNRKNMGGIGERRKNICFRFQKSARGEQGVRVPTQSGEKDCIENTEEKKRIERG